jgi:hypothetical protein
MYWKFDSDTGLKKTSPKQATLTETLKTTNAHTWTQFRTAKDFATCSTANLIFLHFSQEYYQWALSWRLRIDGETQPTPYCPRGICVSSNRYWVFHTIGICLSRIIIRSEYFIKYLSPLPIEHFYQNALKWYAIPFSSISIIHACFQKKGHRHGKHLSQLESAQDITPSCS